jgi:proteic killer suppression protein
MSFAHERKGLTDTPQCPSRDYATIAVTRRSTGGGREANPDISVFRKAGATIPVVIQSFRCGDTEKLFRRERVFRYVNIEAAARRRLDALNAATGLPELLARPGNRLEDLKKDRIGQHSIRINDQYRVCFRWHEGNAYDVEIVDYH